jgi:hypothetical protein
MKKFNKEYEWIFDEFKLNKKMCEKASGFLVLIRDEEGYIIRQMDFVELGIAAHYSDKMEKEASNYAEIIPIL